MQRYDSHVDPEEAQEVIRLAAERHAAQPNDGPTVSGLAEALGLPVEEVDRLLGEVRRRQAPSSRSRTFGDRSAAISAGLALCLAIIAGGFFFGLARLRSAEPTSIQVGLGQRDHADDLAPTLPAEPLAPIPNEAAIAQQDDKQAELEAKIEELKQKVQELAQVQSQNDIDAQIKAIDEEIQRLDKERVARGG